jgi:hypothetical protein
VVLQIQAHAGHFEYAFPFCVALELEETRKMLLYSLYKSMKLCLKNKVYEIFYHNTLNTRGIIGFLALSIIRYSKEHNVSETRSASILRRGGGRHLLCWFRQLGTNINPVFLEYGRRTDYSRLLYTTARTSRNQHFEEFLQLHILFFIGLL